MEQPFALAGVDRRELARLFSQFFLGFVFVFDFRLNGFDVLPDIVAYTMFLLAAQPLKALHPRAANVALLSLMLFPLGLVAMLEPLGTGVLGQLADAAAGLLVILLVWNLAGLVMAVATSLGRADLVRMADNRRMLYALLFGGVTVAGALAWTSGGNIDVTNTPAAPFALGLVVVGIACFVLVMDMLKKTERACLGA